MENFGESEMDRNVDIFGTKECFKRMLILFAAIYILILIVGILAGCDVIEGVIFFSSFFGVVYALLYLWAGKLRYEIGSQGVAVLRWNRTSRYFDRNDIEGYKVVNGQISLKIKNKNRRYVLYYVPKNGKTFSNILSSLKNNNYNEI